MIKHYFWNLLIALDQFVNTIFGGDPDETMSSRIGKSVREDHNPLARACAWVLNKIDRNHCNDAIEPDEGKDDIF